MSLYRIPALLPAMMMAASAIGASPALAQTAEPDDRGTYAVVRAGVAVDTDLRLKTGATGALGRDTDYRPGFTGELGGGYDFGGFRLEGTAGYTAVKLDRKRAEDGGFSANGRTRSFNLGLSGYIDIPLSESVVPYVGGGVGASRVDARLTRTGPAAASRFDDKDWGFQWHADAGLGIRAARATTIDLGVRYTRTSALRIEGASGVTGELRPRLGSVSALIGVRQGF